MSGPSRSAPAGGSGGVYIDATSSTYGADKTGATDTTTAIQAAINAAAAAGGGVVFLPAGLYQITQLAMKKYVRLTGAGYQTILQRKSASSVHMVVIASTGSTGDFFWELDHLAIDGNKAVDANTAADCLYLDGGISPGKPNYWGPYKHSPVCTIHNLFVHNAPRHGVHTVNALREAQLHSLFIERSNQNNYFLETVSAANTDCFYDRCISAFAGGHGFHVGAGGGYSHFVNCKSWWSGKDPSTGNLVSTSHGFFIEGHGSTFEGCEAQDNAGSGVYFSNCNGNRYFGVSSGAHDDAVTFDAATDNHVNVTQATTSDGWISANGVHFINNSHNNHVTYSPTSGVATALVSGPAQNVVDVSANRGAQTAPYAASFTPDPLLGGTISMTLTGNLAVAAATSLWRGLRLRFIFTQDATGGRTVTFDASFKTSWTPNTAANKINVIDFEHNGTNWIQVATTVGL